MRFWQKSFMALSGFGVVLTGSGFALSLADSKVCSTAGCAVIASSARYGEWTVIALGMAFFIALSILGWISMHGGRHSDAARLLTGEALVAACSAEGFLIGYQAFIISTVCRFCIMVSALILLLACVFSLAYRMKWAAAGFVVAFSSILVIMSLVQVPEARVDLSKVAIEKIGTGGQGECYLFFKPDCTHCEKVIDYCREKSDTVPAQVALCPADKCKPVLESLNVKEVPAMLVDKGDKKEILQGEQAILAYLDKNSSGLTRQSSFGEIIETSSSDSCNVNDTCQ